MCFLVSIAFWSLGASPHCILCICKNSISARCGRTCLQSQPALSRPEVDGSLEFEASLVYKHPGLHREMLSPNKQIKKYPSTEFTIGYHTQRHG
ncbi:hypothetical protein I79_015810 [Cricetulus griseus]|uniref:Secreted protein n=1 Tax=Cricetulus griseus TaxID=10029 RepID=G3HXP7_CRIGR|nr:hypothetical protein I79_015810 [Cricetulus griseus]